MKKFWELTLHYLLNNRKQADKASDLLVNMVGPFAANKPDNSPGS